MKFNYALIVIILSSSLHYGCSSSHFYDGEYVFIDSTAKPAIQESIVINGSNASLRFRSLFNKLKITKSTRLCFQHPGKIDLYMGKLEPPLSIPVDREGNLVWDEKLFKKQPIPIILSNPIPEAFLENEK